MLATVPAAVLASLVAAMAGWPSPLEATAEQLMEWTPVSLANLILQYLSGVARPAALLGALAVAMLAGGLAGMLAEAPGRAMAARALGLLLAALFLLVVFLRLVPPVAQAPELILVGMVVAGLGLGALPTRPVSGRRAFLLRTGTIVGGAAALVTVFSVRPLFSALAAKRLFNFHPPRGFRIAGLSDLVTPTDSHYVMDKVLETPDPDPPAWRLTVDGAVARPLELDYGSMLERRRRHRYVTMECVDNPVGGPLISTALWTGIPVRDLLGEVEAHGDTVVFHGADDHSEGIPVRELTRTGALLAYAMNGEVLPREHGYPVRLIMPDHYGFKSVKWVRRIEVIRGAYRDDWVTHGWTATAVVHTTSRIDVTRRSGGETLVAGIAFAGTRGISAVEVRANGGPWRRATLGPRLSGASWVQWAVRLRGRSPVTIEARAIDGTGAVQEARRHGSYPDGATGWPWSTA